MQGCALTATVYPFVGCLCLHTLVKGYALTVNKIKWNDLIKKDINNFLKKATLPCVRKEALEPGEREEGPLRLLS
jgi:hypothetical protein